MNDKLNNEYFDWLYKLVCCDRYLEDLSYRKLLYQLYEADFVYTISMDKNRAQEGVDFRYRFGYEFGYSREDIYAYLDTRPCSVLEMMVALAFNAEERIMDDPDIGNRTGQWFWTMIVSLGLGSMDNKNFNKRYVQECIRRFLNREYKPNGEGGLFTVKNHSRDMREVEIWYQFMWYLNEVLEN